MKSKLIFFVSALLFLSACSKKQADEDVSYSSEYKAVPLSNGGTIRGTIKTDPRQKYLSDIETQKDQEVCGLSHKNPASRMRTEQCRIVLSASNMNLSGKGLCEEGILSRSAWL